MKAIWLVLGLAVLVSACSKEASPPAPPAAPLALRLFDAASLARGARLYEQQCAQCHGPQAQGHPDWQTPSDGKFAAAPPLNGTGNDWKRTRQDLAAVIKNGVRRQSDQAEIMPAWKGRYSERDIEDVINWLQSQWPAEVYDAWNKAQGSAPAPKS